MIGATDYSDKDTIAAISTRLGESGIGIVRLSGEKSIKIADKIFKARNNIKVLEMKNYTMAYGVIINKNKEIIDEVILSVMRKPKSYTREDVVEINCHGGITATKTVLGICIKNGARLALPGEFTKRAYLNGRIDLSQAEAVIDIIHAKTDKSLKIAAKNLKGAIRTKISSLKNELLDIIADLEASIDFIEEDLEITSYEDLEKRVSKIYKDIKKLIEDEKKGSLIKDGVMISIIGKPNVGKSSLLNALARKEKAIVTHIPGTTRDAVEEILYIEGIPLIIADTAGIRKSRNLIEKIGVEKSIDYIKDSELILMVIDANNKIEKKDYDILEIIKGKKTIVCINKIDLERKINSSEVKKLKESNIVIEISAKKSLGLDLLEKEIKRNITGDLNFDLEEKIIVNERHRKILESVEKSIKGALKTMERKLSEEFPASELRIAYDLMGEITGDNTSEDILNTIFNKFCIGK